MKKHYYISGLPRSGSTLICNILAQNPKFHVSPATSGCHDVLFAIRNNWDRMIEHKAEGINQEQLRRVLKATMDAYHNTEKEVVFDKGRGWISLVEMIEFIKSEPPKIIVPVRDVAEILASFEVLWRKSRGATQWEFESADFFRSQTVEGRCEIWAGQSQPVGLAYNRVKDAISRGKRECLLFVEFENLTRKPRATMDMIYDFVGEEKFNHDFDNVEQFTKEDDLNIHRIPGLHSIRPRVAPVARKAENILGPSLAAKYYDLEIWRNVGY